MQKNRHLPPTGKKCRYVDNVESEAEPNGLRDAAAVSVSLATDQADPGGQRIQEEILVQLQKMSHRLEAVEQQISSTAQDPGQASTSSSGSGKLSRNSGSLDSSKSSPSRKRRQSKKFVPPSDSSELSSDESVSPSLSFLKSQSMQRKVDKRIRELNGCSHLSGTECSGKYKSKRGGGMSMFQSKTKCYGLMRQFSVGLTGRGSPTTNCLSLSGFKDSVGTFWMRNRVREEIPWFPTLGI